jgi:hypothetical protein
MEGEIEQASHIQGLNGQFIVITVLVECQGTMSNIAVNIFYYCASFHSRIKIRKKTGYMTLKAV